MKIYVKFWLLQTSHLFKNLRKNCAPKVPGIPWDVWSTKSQFFAKKGQKRGVFWAWPVSLHLRVVKFDLEPSKCDFPGSFGAHFLFYPAPSVSGNFRKKNFQMPRIRDRLFSVFRVLLQKSQEIEKMPWEFGA